MITKLATCTALALLVTGCGKKGDAGGSGSAPAGSSGAAAPGAPGTAGGAAVESFFAGDVPADVKLKPGKSWAMDPGILFFQPVLSWSGGQLPGYEYMSMSKDQAAVFRVATSTGVTGQMGCAQLASAAAMAPAKIKNLQETSPAKMTAVGKNKFAAMEGACSGDGPKGAVDLHYIDIARESQGGTWHYAVMVSFPKDASAELKNEARALARSLEFNGKSSYKL